MTVRQVWYEFIYLFLSKHYITHEPRWRICVNRHDPVQMCEESRRLLQSNQLWWICWRDEELCSLCSLKFRLQLVFSGCDCSHHAPLHMKRWSAQSFSSTKTTWSVFRLSWNSERDSETFRMFKGRGAPSMLTNCTKDEFIQHWWPFEVAVKSQIKCL